MSIFLTFRRVKRIAKAPVREDGEDTFADGNGAREKQVKNGDKDAWRDSKALELYLEDIANVHEYDEEERERLYAELLNGSGEAAAKLSESMLKEVALIAREYASEKVGLEDLIQEGNLGIFVRLGELCGMGEDCGYDVEEEMAEAADNAIRAYVAEATGRATRRIPSPESSISSMRRKNSCADRITENRPCRSLRIIWE